MGGKAIVCACVRASISVKVTSMQKQPN